MRVEVSSKHLFTTTCLHHSLQVHTQHTAMYTTRRVLALHTLLLNASSLSTRVRTIKELDQLRAEWSMVDIHSDEAAHRLIQRVEHLAVRRCGRVGDVGREQTVPPPP